MTDDVMHVGIEEPIQKRKDVLSIAIDVIQSLKEFEIHKKVNKEKAVYRRNFIQTIKELSRDIQEFKEKIPTMHVKEEEKEVKKEKITAIKIPITKRTKTHLTKLEDDITSLRDKIASL